MRDAQVRIAHGGIALVATVAVVWQLVLVARGDAVLAETVVPPLSTRLVRFVSYFTIQSNLLVLATSGLLALDPRRDGRAWRVVRMDAMVGIAVTGVVHWFFLRPLLHLHGASYAVDKLLHVVVPVLAVAAWAVVGPRGQATRRELPPSLLWPALWAAYTLAMGAATGWYPYPFVDAATLGYPRTLVNVVGIAVLLGGFAALLVAADRGLRRRELRVAQREHPPGPATP